MPIGRVGTSVLHETGETASTNDDARALAEAGAPHGTAVLATSQTRGRGRASRAFDSPPGGLYLSVVVRLERPPHEWSLLPLATGHAVAEELRAQGFDVGVKWPNDLVIGAGKVGGVLTESRWGADPFAIVGIGLNLDRAPVPGATALREHGVPPERRRLAQLILERLLAELRAWEREGRDGVLARVRASCVTLGRRVEWDGGEGLAIGVAEDGALLVDAPGGRQRVVAGDVRLRVQSSSS